MGLYLTPSHHYTQHVTLILTQTWNPSIWTVIQHTQFWTHTISTIGMYGGNLWETTQATCLCSLLSRLMVPWTSSTSLQINTFYKIDTGLDNKPKPEAFFPAFMKTPNFSSREMVIHADAYHVKYLKTPFPWSPFQVGYSQLKEISELYKHLMQKSNSQIGMNYPPTPFPIMKQSSKLPRVKDHTDPPPRFNPDE